MKHTTKFKANAFPEMMFIADLNLETALARLRLQHPEHCLTVAERFESTLSSAVHYDAAAKEFLPGAGHSLPTAAARALALARRRDGGRRAVDEDSLRNALEDNISNRITEQANEYPDWVGVDLATVQMWTYMKAFTATGDTVDAAGLDWIQSQFGQPRKGKLKDNRWVLLMYAMQGDVPVAHVARCNIFVRLELEPERGEQRGKVLRFALCDVWRAQTPSNDFHRAPVGETLKASDRAEVLRIRHLDNVARYAREEYTKDYLVDLREFTAQVVPTRVEKVTGAGDSAGSGRKLRGDRIGDKIQYFMVQNRASAR